MDSKRRLSSMRKLPSMDSDEQLHMSKPKKRTKDRLIKEIINIGIKVPCSLRVSALVQIYNDNKVDTLPISDTPDRIINKFDFSGQTENSSILLREVEAAAMSGM